MTRCVAIQRCGFALWLVLGAVLLPGVARAHPLAPAALILRELGETPRGTLEATWRTTRLRPRGERLSPVLPDHCERAAGSETETESATEQVIRWQVVCGDGPLAGVHGHPIRIAGLTETTAIVFVELQLRDGDSLSALLDAHEPSVTFREGQSASAAARPGFMLLGMSHLLSGADHVLFVMGLVLLVASLRLLIWQVTAFTMGHSLSLALSATGVVTLPRATVELAIALSLFWLAHQVLARRVTPGQPAPAPRRAALLCAAFGLLHGLGFASEFANTGAAGNTLPGALLGFNIGIELGQLMVLVPSALVLGVLRRHRSGQTHEPRVKLVGAYGIGTASAYFVLERAPSVLTEVIHAID